MLGFLRRYQRILFIAVTAMIIVSFSLVGTYRNAGEPTRDDTVAFQTIDGRPVTRSWLTKMVRFCGSDAIDKFQYGGVEGPNFFFGHDRAGDVNRLREFCQEAGIAVEIVEPIEDDGQAGP